MESHARVVAKDVQNFDNFPLFINYYVERGVLFAEALQFVIPDGIR